MTFRTLPLVLVTLLAGVPASWAQATAQPPQAGAPAGTPSGTQPRTGTPTDTDAQTPPDRKVALDPTDLMANQAGWTMLVSAFGGHENTNWGATGSSGAAGEQFLLSGANGGGSLRLAGMKAARKGTYSIDGTATSVYYPSGDRFLTDSILSASGTRVLAQRTELRVAQTMTYAPYYGIGLFPSLGSYTGTDMTSAYTPTFDTGTQTNEVFRLFVNAALSKTLSNRAEVSIHYGLRRNDVLERTNASYAHEVGGRYQRRINRALGYHLGYDYGTMRYGGPLSSALNTFDVGLDFDRALSVSRRTVFQFTTSSAMVKAKPLDASQADRARIDFRLLGSANLKHYLGRSWVMDASYVRDAQILEGLSTVYYTDGINVGFSGRLGARSTAGASLGYVTGIPLAQFEHPRDRAQVLSAWVQRRLSASVAGFARFSSYSQRFNYDQLQSLGLADRLSKYSIRVGVNVVYPRNRATR